MTGSGSVAVPWLAGPPGHDLGSRVRLRLRLPCLHDKPGKSKGMTE